MIDPRYLQLLKTLLDKTRDNLVDWKETASEDEFIVYFERFALSLRRGFDQEENEEFVRVVLRNNKGKELDNFWISVTNPHWTEVSDLHESARRKARRIDEALDVILKELTSDKIIGKGDLETQDDEPPF